jgi:hypothetical protein
MFEVIRKKSRKKIVAVNMAFTTWDFGSCQRNFEGGQWLPLGRKYGYRGLLTRKQYWEKMTGEDSVS